MDPKFLRIGDLVAHSSVGAGKVTGFTKGGYPEVNGRAVGNLVRTDGEKYGGAASTLQLDPAHAPAGEVVAPLASMGDPGTPAPAVAPPAPAVVLPEGASLGPAGDVVFAPPTGTTEIVAPPATDEHVAPGHSLFSDPDKLKPLELVETGDNPPPTTPNTEHEALVLNEEAAAADLAGEPRPEGSTRPSDAE